MVNIGSIFMYFAGDRIIHVRIQQVFSFTGHHFKPKKNKCHGCQHYGMQHPNAITAQNVIILITLEITLIRLYACYMSL